jgi:hypothetical protein
MQKSKFHGALEGGGYAIDVFSRGVFGMPKRFSTYISMRRNLSRGLVVQLWRALLWRERDYKRAVSHSYLLVQFLLQKRRGQLVKLSGYANVLSGVIVESFVV